MPIYKCKLCGEKGFENRIVLYEHYRKVHPEHVIKRSSTASNVIQGTALDKLNEHRKGIGETVKQLEFERDQMMLKIREYDDVIAKYKKLI